MARIDFLTRDEVYAEHAHLFTGYEEPSSDSIRDVHRVLANNSRLFDSWGEGLNTRYEIYDDYLGPRVRELVHHSPLRAQGNSATSGTSTSTSRKQPA